MSVNEEGIPLMQVFGEEQQSDNDNDDSDNPFEDEEVEPPLPARGHSNTRRHICFGAVLVFALVLLVVLVMGFTIPTLIIQNEGGTVDHHHGGGTTGTGNTKTGTRSSMTHTATSKGSSTSVIMPTSSSTPTTVVPSTNSTQLQVSPTSTSMERPNTLTQSITIHSTQLSQSSSTVPVPTSRLIPMMRHSASTSMERPNTLTQSMTIHSTQLSQSSSTVPVPTTQLIPMMRHSASTSMERPNMLTQSMTIHSTQLSQSSSTVPVPTTQLIPMMRHSASTSMERPNMLTQSMTIHSTQLSQSSSTVPVPIIQLISMMRHSASTSMERPNTFTQSMTIHSTQLSQSSSIVPVPTTQLIPMMRHSASSVVSVPKMDRSTPTMTQLSSPVPTMTQSNHVALAPTSYIASKSLDPTPEVASESTQKQMVSTVLPTPTPSSATPAMTPLPTLGTVGKSAMDRRTYQVLSLKNQLRVLLISDPNTSISAAAMDVAVGSFSNPPEVVGLAHFCEHMLFLGTQKYPEEDAYSNFLSTHGGYDNAFTSTQETNYYFSVQADYLEQALDRFAQFFIAPLLSPGAVSKESHAVNAEHEKNLQSDGWRLWQLLKHVSNPSHPFSRFATGNLETLNNSNILKYLHNYYNSHYSANQMQLVIYGRDPIENLTSWADEHFSPINNSNVSSPTFNTTSFPPEYSGKIVYYYPVANRDTLDIYWQTPPLQGKYRNAVSQFLTRYLGHEGKGSILWKLRTDSGLATSLTAGIELDTDSYTLLFVSIDITSDGLSRLSEIISIVFQYVRYLTSHFGEQEWEDFVRVHQLNFDYAKKAKAEDYVVTISETMRLVTDPADFLGTPYRFVSNFSLVNDTLNYLTPENSVIFIGSQKLNFSNSSQPPVSQQGTEPVPWPSELTEFEPIYGTPYHKTNLSSSLIHYWRTDNNATSSLHLPGKNQFFPKDLSLLKAQENGSKVPVEIPIDNYPGVSLWWLQDTEFREPRVYLHCDLNTSNAENTAAWTAKSQLFVYLVDQLLESQVYAAEEVGYSYSLSASPHGLTLSFSGLSDPVTFGKFVNLVTGVLANIGKQPESSKLFILAKDDETDYLMNYNLTTLPYQYYRYIQLVVLERPYWRHWELLSEVKKLGLEEIVSFANNLLSNVTFLCFAHGNVNESQALNYIHTLVSPLSSKLIQTHPVGHFWRRRVKLSSGSNYSVVIPALNPEDVNSVVNVLFQVGSMCHLVQSEDPGSYACSVDSLRMAVLLGLLNQIMEDQCFYQLRTIQQLGYAVFCHNRVNEGVGSFEVVVQSQEYEPGDVLERINSFVESFEDYLSINMTEEEWETQVEVYRDTLQRRDTNLADKSSRLWGQISIGQLQFEYSAEAAGVLDTLNATTLLDFYHHNMVDRESYKKMVIVAYGRGKSGNLPYIDIPIDYTKLNFLSIPCPNGTVCK